MRHKWQETQFESKILEDMARGGTWQQESLRASGTWGWEGLAHVVVGRGGFFFFLIGIYFKCRLGRKVVGGQVARSVCVAVCECVEACLME